MGRHVVVEPVDDTTVRVDGHLITTSNLRAKWNQLEEGERLSWLKKAVPALLWPPRLPTQLKTVEYLRPGLRPRSMLEAARLAGATTGTLEIDPTSRPSIPSHDFGGDIVTVLLWDGPNTMSMINQPQLDGWGANFEDLLPVAIDNLAEQPDAGWTAVENRVWTSLNSDDYDGARLLVPGYLDQTGLAGELVITHPHRNLLIITASDDAEGIQTSCELALEELDAPSPISLRPIIGEVGNWRSLSLPKTHPAYSLWRRLTYIDKELGYASVRAPLQEYLGDELLVVPYTVIHDDEDNYTSYCTWTEGSASLIPRTDMIDLVDHNGTVLTVPWDEVRKLVNLMMEPTEHYPELWRVVSFPTKENLIDLKKFSRTDEGPPRPSS